MEKILGNIYCWFQSLFGNNLAEHLWGWDGVAQDYLKQNQFYSIGLIGIATSAFIVILYYYILNHPRFSKWWSWLIMLGFTGIINIFIGYGMTYSDVLNGLISDDLMYVRDKQGEIIETLITESNCWGFGAANMFVSILFFIILSFGLKWWSTNCKRSPF